MNAALNEKKIRLGEAALAIGASPKSISHWLTRYADEIVVGDGSKAGWAEYSLLDVCYFAVTKVLVDYGLPANKAFRVAKDVLQQIWGPMLSYKNTPAAALVLGLNFNQLVVTMEAGDVKSLDIEILPSTSIRAYANEAHCLYLNLWKIVGSAMKNLADMGYETSGLEYGEPVPFEDDEGLT